MKVGDEVPIQEVLVAQSTGKETFPVRWTCRSPNLTPYAILGSPQPNLETCQNLKKSQKNVSVQIEVYQRAHRSPSNFFVTLYVAEVRSRQFSQKSESKVLL